MPLQTISSSEAMGRLRGDGRRVIWPDHREPTKRLEGLVDVSCQPTFEIRSDDRIFTMGSCFARNIERRLREIGFVTPMYDSEVEQTLQQLGHGLEFLNKYSTPAMRAEVEWACGLERPAEEFV